MTEYFVLDGPDFSWGDYGRILLHGMSCHLGRNETGHIQLERTGPFIPPISFPGAGDIVVTTPFRRRLEASGLTGFEFRPVVKAHVVEVNWHKWDRSAAEPQQIPPGGEPENYILGKRHSNDVSALLGKLWELVPRETSQVIRRPKGPGSTDVDIVLLTDSVGTLDLFRAEGVGYNFVSAHAREWFRNNAGEWCSFRRALVE